MTIPAYASQPMAEFVWTPTPEQIERANVTRLIRRLGCADFDELQRLSVKDPERFWPAVVDDLGIEFSRPWEHVLDTSRGIEWTTWFVGGRLNLAWNCVHKWAQGERADEEAAVFLGEDGVRASLTWAQVSRAVTKLAEALVAAGIEPGDRVGIFMPMS